MRLKEDADGVYRNVMRLRTTWTMMRMRMRIRMRMREVGSGFDHRRGDDKSSTLLTVRGTWKVPEGYCLWLTRGGMTMSHWRHRDDTLLQRELCCSWL